MLHSIQAVSLWSKVKTTWLSKEPIILLLLISLAFISFLPGLGSYGMLDPTDSFFVETSREMLEKHHYVTVLFNYSDWLDKPSLAFLLIIFCYKIFGVSVWAARLPSALSAITLVAATYALSRRVLGRRAAILAAIILSTSPLFLIVGHVALTDEPLAMLISIALLYIGTSLAKDCKVDWLAYVFLSLAVLCKGPIALVLTAGTIFVYLIIVSSSFSAVQKSIKQLRPMLGLGILVLCCLPYYYLAHVTTDGAFTAQFFMRQNVGRFQGTVNHKEPFWFYVPVIFGGYFPWIFYLFLGMPWLKRIFSHRLQLTRRQAFLVFCFSWVICVGLLFTLIPTKLPTYIVPFSPALAILIAAYLDSLVRLKNTKRSVGGLLTLFSPALIVLLVSLVGLIMLPKLAKQGVPAPVLVGGTLIVVAILALRSLLAFWKKEFLQGIISLSGASIIACVVIVPCGFLWFYHNYEAGIIRLITTAQTRGGNLAILFSSVPSTIFYLRHPVPEVQSLSELADFCRTGKSPHLLLARRNCLDMPKLKAQQHIIAIERKWYLLDVEGFPW